MQIRSQTGIWSKNEASCIVSSHSNSSKEAHILTAASKALAVSTVVTALHTSTSYSTLNWVSTEAGDSSVYHPIWVFNEPYRTIQPGYIYVGRRNEYWQWSWPSLGKKLSVLHNSESCYQDCWHTGLISCYMSQPSNWRGSYISLILQNSEAIIVPHHQII